MQISKIVKFPNYPASPLILSAPCLGAVSIP